MAEDDDPPKQHVIFGSAGMAASGMMSGSKPKPKLEEEPEEEPAEEVDAEWEASEDKSTTPDEAAEAIEESPDEEAADAEVSENEADSDEEPAAADEVANDEPEEAAKPDELFTGLNAAVVGETGSNGFGHGMDQMFQGLDEARLVAVVDLNEDAAAPSGEALGVESAYASLEAMFEEQSPDIVCVGSGRGDRLSQIQSALGAGGHVFCEGPIAQSLKEADEVLAAEKKAEKRVAVRNPMRVDPHLLRFHQERESLIGDLLQIHVWGNCDETSGGEDLLLRGVPLFEIVRWFAGEVSYCTAGIFKDDFAALAEDAQESENNDLGPLLGDTIRAEFEMESGIRVTFVSDPKVQSALGPAGIEFVGTKSRMRLFAGAPVTLSLLQQSDRSKATRKDKWKKWPEVEGDYHPPVDHLVGEAAANRLVVKELIAAISDDRELAGSATDAMKALEMAHGIWQAGATMKRAYFPLANRLHPLSEESQ